MSDTLKIIHQTHRTILFEEFTDKSDEDASSLASIIEASLASGTFDKNDFYRKIDDNLVVRTFDEFVARFAPKVYEYITDINGMPVFAYTTDMIEARKRQGRLIKLEGHPFFRMLVEMYSQKGGSGLSNLDFPENKIKEILTPDAQMEEVYDMRRTLRSLAIDYEKAREAGQSTKPYEDGIYKCREKISEKFEDSPRALLALAITETTKKIETAREGISQLENAESGETPALAFGRLGFDANGKLTVKKIPEKTTGKDGDDAEVLSLEERAIKPVLALVEADIREYGPEDEFSQALVLSAYAPAEVRNEEAKTLPQLQEEVSRLTQDKEMYEKVYRQAQDAFIKTLALAAQKMLCVKVFFDHATVKGGSDGKLPAGLLVTNCKASKLLKDDIKNNFATAMKHMGEATEGKKIWFGILPDVQQEEAVPEAAGGLNRPLRPRGERKADKKISSNVVDLTVALTLLDVMNKSSILTVFSFAPDKENSFATLSANSVEKMENLVKDHNNPHAVLAYPNFTVMREGTLELGNEKITIPAVYVSACYVAAGLLAASQQPEMLESRGLGSRLIPGNACTRIDLEDEDLINMLPTKFNRELAYSWPTDVIPKITRRRFGFVFCSDPKRDVKTREPVKYSYVLQARTLGTVEDKYQPIYRTLTQDFIDAYMREFSPGEDVSEEMIGQFEEDFRKWENEANKGANSKKLNVMLQPNEKMEVREEDGEKIFVVSLKGGKVTIKRKVKVQNIGEENK